MSKTDLTAERLKELLNYDKDTGVFTRIVQRGRQRRLAPGTKAGYQHGVYWRINVYGEIYSAHRLAWFYAHGEWPKQEIDHINGDKSDNRLCNLRDVPKSINMQNKQAAHVGSVSGFLGVSFKKDRSKWLAHIGRDGKRLHIGYFSTPEAAHAAYIEAKRRLHPGCTI